MRYAIFTDIHANLEALEAVLAKIDELAQGEPIDQIWFLGDLVGYGPNPNECITRLRERTDVIIAGNHDWAAVGKIDLEDFSAAARISAEWTAKQLTQEHHTFLAELPERLEIGECTLVHGSPYGPLWEYLTSEVLAERSFQHFSSRYCFVGHTHVPIIFQQPDTIATMPTIPLGINEAKIQEGQVHDKEQDEETTEMAPPHSITQTAQNASPAEGPHEEADTYQNTAIAPTLEAQQSINDEPASAAQCKAACTETRETIGPSEEGVVSHEEDITEAQDNTPPSSMKAHPGLKDERASETQPTPEETILSAEDRLNQEIEELLTLLGLSQSMVSVTNEMIIPPEGDWQAPQGYRAIVNPGGVGQPRDGDARAAFMIYDTKRGFTFYRVPYPFEKTQEKIIKVGLPQYLATRLAYGR